MPRRWISIVDAIARLEKELDLDSDHSAGRMAEIAVHGVVSTRAASVVDWQGRAPRRNVVLASQDWSDLLELKTSDWFSNGSASFPGDVEWLGIETDERELMAYINSRRRSKPSPMMPTPTKHRPGPKLPAELPAAIDHVKKWCLKHDYTKELKRGQKAQIARRILSYLAERGVERGEDAGSNYAESVIERLPDK